MSDKSTSQAWYEENILRARKEGRSRCCAAPIEGNNLLDTCTQGGEKSPSTCHSGRLWSLWDMMRVFQVGTMCGLLDSLHAREASLAFFKMRGQGADALADEDRQQITDIVDRLKRLFDDVDIPACSDAAANCLTYLASRGLDVSGARQTLHRFKSDVIHATSIREFVSIADDRIGCIDKDMPFGKAVFDAFESARDDIASAYNCLAVECPTAAVFHFMRAAEIGLRALAFDREVKVFHNKRAMLELPLELASWDQVIRELEEAELEIEGYPKTLTRQAQFDFYHGANMQFRAFKNVFRNSIMHTRESFDRDEATSLSHKVGEFMQILASRIKEGDRTPRIWT